MSGIYVYGDVHQEFGLLNSFINKKQPDIVMLAGDIAYFWEADPQTNVGRIKPQNGRVYWTHGNHDNMDIVKDYERFPYGKIHQLEPRVFFCSFGSVLQLPDGRTVLFCGGADSIDKHHPCRKEHISWWRNETIQESEFRYLPNPDEVKIDIVVSHTCPNYFIKGLDLSPLTRDKAKDPSCEALDSVMDMYKPTEWYFGHFHRSKMGMYDSNKGYRCRWRALDCHEPAKI